MVGEQCLQDGVPHTLKRKSQNGILKGRNTLIMSVLLMTNRSDTKTFLRMCDPEYWEEEDCENCPAKQWCDRHEVKP